MTKNNNEQEKKRIRRIVELIIVIIILLLLIRSCSIQFNWTIGRLFGTSSEHDITENSDDIIILNKNLKFDIKEETINLNNKNHKISFSFKTIKPNDFTCTTSDANIATCYVKDGYVVINPKNVGEVSVFLETKTNNKVYRASMKLNIEDIPKSLNLSSKSGTIVLSKTNKKILTYNLNNIDGEVNVKSSDEEIATVTVSNGVITITGKKTGNCKITVTVTDKNTNKTYTVTYKLNIVATVDSNKPNDSIETPTDKPINTPKPSESPTPSTKPGETNKPTTEPTPSTKPEIVKDNNNYLKTIELSKGELSPEFSKDTLNYNVNVNNNITSTNITVKKDSNKSSIKYTFNNKTVTNLNDLSLKVGDNTVIIEVTAENKEKRTYTIIINRKEKDNYSNYLSNLSIDGYNISPNFNKETSFYTLTVPYNESSIKLNYNLEDIQSTVNVTNNNNKISDLSNVTLNSGDNKIELTVTDKSGAKRVYIINIYKPVRTIKFYNDSYTMYIEQSPYKISYKVLEDNIEINDYNLSDVSLNISGFNGTYTLNKGYISINPTYSDINNTYDINISYNNKTVTTKLSIKTNSYYINSPALEYDVTYVNNSGKKNIIINNNLLVGNITKTSLTDGFRLSTSNGAYIDVKTDSNIIHVSYDMANSDNNSIVVIVDALLPGTANIKVSGNIFDNKINEYNIKLNIIDKYNITIDANGGFFDSVTDKYTYLVESNETIDLSEFNALKVDDEVNCLFFKLDSFNTKSDGTGTKYNKTDLLTNFNSDITLYAIYTSTSSFETIESNERLYLTEVDLFHNEEYYEKYNIDKVIYPGAEGSHVMSLTNKGIGKIKITGINLEEDTLCVSDGRCLNIGYIIKSALDVNEPYTYFYGDNNNYKVLNKDNNTTHTFGSLTGYHTENNISFNPNLEIEVGETKEISILWKWVNIDDELDTIIGSSYQTIGDTYALTVSIDFERESNTCTLP